MEIHCFVDDQIRIGIKSANQLLSLVVEETFNPETLPRGKPAIHHVFLATALLCINKFFALIGERRLFTRKTKPKVRAFVRSRVVVVATVPLGIKNDRASLNAGLTNLERTSRNTACKRRQRVNTLGEHDPPFKNLHSAHRATDNRKPFRNAQFVGNCSLRTNNVSDRYDGKRRTIGTTGFRIRR